MSDRADSRCVTLDVRGLPCPRPVAVLRQRLEGLEAGDELVVVGDDPATEASIRRACERHGFDVSAGPPTEEATEFSLRIQVTAFSSL